MLNKIRKLREKKGFTLVELIVVIAIIAILTAVLVPLIGNWTQQAAYTTLQDGAQTVSNSVNNALSKVTMGGAPASVHCIQVEKSGTGVYTITIDGTPVTADEDRSTEEKIAQEVENILEATMPNNSAFLASVKNGAVDGVVYRNDKGTQIEDCTIDTVGDIKDAFEVTGTDGYACGTSGKFKGAGTISDTGKAAEVKFEAKAEAEG